LNPTSILKALPVCIVLAACDEPATTEAVSRAAPQPVTLEGQVEAHNSQVANTLVHQITSVCGGKTGDIFDAFIEDEHKRKGNRMFASPRQNVASMNRRIDILTDTAECRETEFRKRALVRASDLVTLKAETGTLRSKAAAAGLPVATPMPYEKELDAYDYEMSYLSKEMNRAEFALARAKARKPDIDSWVRAFGNAASTLSQQYAAGTSTVNRYANPPSTLSGAVSGTYAQSSTYARSAATAMGSTITLTQTSTPAPQTSGPSNKLCADGRFTYYCKDEAKVQAAIKANGGSAFKDNLLPLNPGSGPQTGATIDG